LIDPRKLPQHVAELMMQFNYEAKRALNTNFIGNCTRRFGEFHIHLLWFGGHPYFQTAKSGYP
jgi:hypothetical protein